MTPRSAQRAVDDELLIAELLAGYPQVEVIEITPSNAEVQAVPSTTAQAAVRLRQLINETRPLPRDLTDSVRSVLGLMLWQTTPIAQALRRAGRVIAFKVELEQAYVLHWLLGFAIEHGDAWETKAARALHEIINASQNAQGR